MLDLLRIYDPAMVELQSGHGSVLVPPALGGRIFCQMDGELIHRLDASALLHPSPTEYDNLGGNSLWPAPEGGEYAFNYGPGSDTWVVQEGVAKTVPSVVLSNGNRARIDKRINLVNRKGLQIDLDYKKIIKTQKNKNLLKKYKIK